tara:strand:- start:385 stop:1086 length:702 start_codon:yes stop_codon:yes gene_type:complete
MAFKMKGNPYKMGGTKTKDTMAYMKSPMKDSKSNYDSDGQFKELQERENNKAHNKSHSDGLPADHKRKEEADKGGGAKEKSPIKQTDFFDKIKAAGGALYDNVGKVHGHGTSDSFSSNVAKSYGKKKKEYREAAADGEKKSSNKMKSPMEQKRKITKEGKKLAKDYKKKVIKDSKDLKKSNIAVVRKVEKEMGYEGAKADIKDERKRHRDTKKKVRKSYRDAKKLYKSGGNPE